MVIYTWVVLFFVLSVGAEDGGLHRTHTKSNERLEDLAEAYYEAQKAERTEPWSPALMNYGANWPCLYGTFPIGENTTTSIDDGHKFGCGIHRITGPPIVYSIGSDLRQDFEIGMLSLRPDSIIHIYEIRSCLWSDSSIFRITRRD